MKIHKLAEKTKLGLKSLDAEIQKQAQEFQALLQKQQLVVKGLQTQKQNMLQMLVAEKGLPDGLHLNLNVDYDLEEVSEEEFKKLTQQPGAEEIPMKASSSKMKAAKKK